MAEPTDTEDLPKAVVARPKRSRISIIWIIPILAALVAIGIAIQRIGEVRPSRSSSTPPKASRPARRSSSTRT
jgi:paraquat-inducible protein B